MGKPQRQKGLRNENRIKNLHTDLGIKATRISAPYKSGPDLQITIDGDSLAGEVKARKDGAGWKIIKRWITNANALFLVEDREEPLVVLRWETYAALISRKDDPNVLEEEIRPAPLQKMQPDL